jgi:hypothetical protein
MSNYVPPHRRMAAPVPVPVKTEQDKKDRRDMFPLLRDTEGKNVVPVIHKPQISWSGISFKEDDVILDSLPPPLKDGWIALSTYVPDKTTTSAQLNRCAENMLSNYTRFFVERCLPVPEWITNNPYDNFEDFDRTIPYEQEYVSESESSSDGEDPLYESDVSM